MFPRLVRLPPALSRRVVACLAVCLVFAAANVVRAQDAAVVRLAYVNGSVQILQNGVVQFDKAVANMPLFKDSQVVTATDGQAEIEFADGSVARLTPTSSLQLTHVQGAGTNGHTDIELTSGLAYFELNVGQGQRFSVKIGPATAHPEENTIFRANLDKVPEIAVFQGALHVDGDDATFTTNVTERQTIRFDENAADPYTLVQAITPDSWDKWNMDRDDAIARQAESQTDARNDSAAPQDPGWNDLDAAGDWYPVDGYGNVWVPNGVDASWDPFGYGYWADYGAYGTTWISGYPWGWLPYHCGAWNYFPFGWGWIPGGCGLGWSPMGTIWNAPPNYRRPLVPPGGFAIAGRTHRPGTPRLVPVDRGPAARGPWGPGAGLNHTIATPQHRQSLTIDGSTLEPLAHRPAPGIGVQGDRLTTATGAHVGIPVARPANANEGGRVPMPQRTIGAGIEGTRAPVVTRPSYTAPPPRYEAPAPRVEPQHSAPPPAPPAAAAHPH
jgi:hypothetical protein